MGGPADAAYLNLILITARPDGLLGLQLAIEAEEITLVPEAIPTIVRLIDGRYASLPLAVIEMPTIVDGGVGGLLFIDILITGATRLRPRPYRGGCLRHLLVRQPFQRNVEQIVAVIDMDAGHAVRLKVRNEVCPEEGEAFDQTEADCAEADDKTDVETEYIVEKAGDEAPTRNHGVEDRWMDRRHRAI